MKKINIRFMFWYMKTGRFIFGELFAISIVITLIQLLGGRINIFIAIFVDIALAFVSVILETYLIIYRGRGIVYVETDKREDRFNLVEYHTNGQNYFVKV